MKRSSVWRILAVVVVAVTVSAAVVAVSPGPAFAQSGGFGDVADDRYFSVPVKVLAEQGVFAGTECAAGFCPDEPIDRKTMAVWIVRVLDGQDPEAVTTTRFDDVAADSFYAPFIERMAELEVTTGCGDLTIFCPDDNVSRAQAATFLSRAFKLPDGPDPGFSDVPGDTWYTAHVARLAASGITTGCGDLTIFCPDDNVSRAQMATFLYRALAVPAPLEPAPLEPAPLEPAPLETVDYNQINGLLSSIGALDDAEGCPKSATPGSLEGRVEFIRIEGGCVLIEYEQLDGRTLAQARRDLAEDPTVIAADLPVAEFRARQDYDYASGDPDAGRQWHLRQLDAKALWDGWPAGALVTVAVIDSGVDATHGDLNDNVVDTGHDCHRRDQTSHGTHVAGIAAAEAGNGVAVAGIAPQARILSIKMPLGEDEDLRDRECEEEVQTLPQALQLAVENGADVINMSLGVVWHQAIPFPTTWDVAIHLATTSNVVLVASAGNRGIRFSNRDAPEIPAIHPDVISVAATTESGARASFSTSNRWVDIAAPGYQIYSTVPCSGASGCSSGDNQNGTSMAAPMVSGVVAHMKARYPDATPAQIRQAMFSTALQPGSTQTGVRTNDFGWGMIQPHAAIVALGSAVGVDNAAPRFISPSQRSVAENTTGAGAVTAVDEDDAVTGYTISGGSDQGLFTVNSNGDLEFVSPADFEAPTDADTDNIYEVAVTATSGFGARALTATQTIRLSVTDTAEPPGAPDPPTLEPATGSVSAVWDEPATSGPPINDYDLQYRAVDSPDEVLGTREWNDVGRDLWNVGCEIWNVGGDGRDLWDDTWDGAGKAGRDVGDLIGDRLLRSTDAGTGWGHVWDTGCDIWRDLGETIWGPIWEVGEDFAEIGNEIAEGFADWFDRAGDDGRGIGAAIGDLAQAFGDIFGSIGDVFGGIFGIFGIFANLSTLEESDWSDWADWPHTGTTTTATITRLDEGSAYQARVRANSLEGSGIWSEPSTASTTVTGSNAPPRFTSPAAFEVREPAVAVGTVAASDADSQDSVNAYQISGGADAASLRIDPISGTLEFTVAPDYENPTDADSNNDYEVTVTATGGAGRRLLAAMQTITVAVTDDTSETAGPPAAPPEPSLVDASETSLTVQWQQPASAGSTVVGYDVQYRQADPAGGWSGWPHTGTTRRTTISGLDSNTRYQVRVRAIGRAGAGEWSQPLVATTASNRAPRFTSPASVAVRENTIQAVKVRAVDTDAPDSVSTYGITAGADHTAFEIDGLGNLAFKSAPDYDDPQDANGDNTYEVVVAATSGRTQRIRTTTQQIRVVVTDDTSEAPPGPPNQHYAFEGSSIVLGWDAVADASYYRIYYDDFFSSGCRVSSGGRASFCEELAANINDTSYTHSDPDPDTNYYWVVACNSSGCSPVDSNRPATTVGTAPDTPTARYVFEGSTIVLGWDAVADASYYRIYYDDFFSSSCRVSSGGRASFCEELATNITGTSYTHTDPDDDNNYYWVVACNNSGCSPVDSDSPATTVGTAPDTPTARYAFEGSTIVLGWDAVADASYYRIYYDDFHDSSCRVSSGGNASFCKELATNITGTSYTHTDPDDDNNYYWVVACNNSGCSPVDSNNPATTVGTAPDTPTARYAFEGSTIVLGWDAVADASYYRIYYDDFHDSSCRVNSGGNASFCKELATNITGTSYTHTDPDDDNNYYWVVACNNSGCSPVDSNNPATTVGTAPDTPTARYAFEGSGIVLSWDAVADASYYRIYYDDFFPSSCRVSSGGNASFCKELATNITGTSYTHTDPDDDNNYYWVVACNSSGCSPVDSNNPATTVATTDDTAEAPPAPTNQHYAFEGSTIVLGWDAVADASYYRIYYDDFFPSSCRVNSGGNASFCKELATNITGTSYTHTDPDDDNNYYWVVACNSSGCSPVDSNNPATTVGTAPDTPTARYAFEGSGIVLSWDAVADASYYRIYYDDFFPSSCRVSSGGNASFCKELATNITGTSYTHTDPDDDNNYYWVVACNSSGCSPVDSNNPATTVATTDDTAEAPPAPTNQHYAFEGSTIVLGWDAVADASYYRIYYDDFFPSSCRVNSGGNASFCKELATNITGTSYTHTDPDDDNNYYWVVACNSSGCSPVDSNNPATTVGTAPDTPTARYAFEGSTIVLSWDAVADASYYRIYYDDFFPSSCRVNSGGNASFCKELATNITGTSYTHTDPDDDNNYYWVVACNSSGCSPVDSNNPATTVGTAPDTPTARYAFEGSTIVLGWDAVADASYYRIYYDDFFPSSCRVSSGGNASFCKELATNITGTSYTHTDPDDDNNYYWVVACNSSGCSPVDSNNPATTVPTTTTA